MHRIAGLFLNGAGLLVLLPVFVKEAFAKVAETFFNHASAPVWESWHAGDWPLFVLSTVAAGALLASLLTTLATPFYSLYQLIFDIVRFYFAGITPGFKGPFIPRFALSALAFPTDEADAQDGLKGEILKTEYGEMSEFLIPDTEEARRELSVDSASRRELACLIPDSRKRLRKEYKISESEDAVCVDIVLGQAGLVDRDLHEEVAKMEISLARHSVFLRRIVLRYAKALLVLGWTTIVALGALALIHAASPVFAHGGLILTTIAASSYAWGLGAPFIVRLPITWIYHVGDHKAEKDVRDRQLLEFELHVMTMSIVAVIASTIAVTALAWSRWAADSQATATVFTFTAIIMLVAACVWGVHLWEAPAAVFFRKRHDSPASEDREPESDDRDDAAA